MTKPITHITKAQLFNLQYRQELHDRLFHTDIYTLSKPRRLVHLVLHQCKYVSRLYCTLHDEPESISGPAIERACLDGFIVAMSMANVCNYKTHEHLSTEQMTPEVCLDKAIRIVGELAKVVEDIDHMVMDSPLTKISMMVGELMCIYVNLLRVAKGWELQVFLDAALARLIDVEKKNIFFTRHAKEIDRLMEQNLERTTRPQVT